MGRNSTVHDPHGVELPEAGRRAAGGWRLALCTGLTRLGKRDQREAVACDGSDLAHQIAQATRERYGPDKLQELDPASEIPALIQGTVNASSPAWQRLDTLIRAQLDT
ncbi:hypothetical protein [Streptomyces himalayensis]|uniref:hypothetical protein n=1 Tax=Streptomyces himalayensis TaxID=2820085 RepID=UPI00215D7179|nr:hypothetical protein [Streptomyces himalayensis]